MTLNIDWQAIHPLGGSKADAFEELCALLARASSPNGWRFIRKGTPDAGVECYAIAPDGIEWAWQAKYFNSQGDSQWAQVDESVENALEKHPKLVKYFVCVPLDLSDARLPKQKSAKDRWDDRVVKWQGWATKRGMSVEFGWMGSHEMLADLLLPKNIPLAKFFFGAKILNNEWFERRLAESISAAGPRYTPALNVHLELTDDLETFGRENSLLDRIFAHARDIRDKLTGLGRSNVKDTAPELKLRVADSVTACGAVLNRIAKLHVDPSAPVIFEGLLPLIEGAASSIASAYDEFDRLRSAAVQDDEGEPMGLSRADWDQNFPYHLNELYRGLTQARNHIRGLLKTADSRLLVLKGLAGSGKTHLLCDFAQRRVQDRKPTLVLMGQRFLNGTDPWTQVLQQLGETGWTTHEFIGALEVAAQIADTRALLVIDAINEGNGLSLWPANMAAFLKQAQASPWISVVVSVRTAYENILVPDEVREQAVRLNHSGFSNVEYDAMTVFFEFYQIELPSTPLLAAEFQNPLFLKTLCSGLKSMGERRLPRGSAGISNTFKFFLKGINRKLALELDYREDDDLVERAVLSLAQAMAKACQPWQDLSSATALVDAHLPGRPYSKSLFANLLREGVLLEERIFSEDDKRIAVVLLGYERMSDYFIGRALLDEHLDLADPAKAFRAGGALDFLPKRSAWPTAGIHEVIHVLIAERTRTELLDLIPHLAKNWPTAHAFRQSVVWRDVAAVTPRTAEVLLEVDAREGYAQQTIETLLTVATLPGHPLNADYLDIHLRSMAMPDRDAWWSTALHQMWGNKGAVDRLVHWAESVWPHTLLEDDAVRLGAITLAWFLSSSNRFLRDRASKGLLRLLTGRLALSRELVAKFAGVDDLYVAERLLGAVYGAMMRSSERAGVAEVAAEVHANVFASGQPRPHVLFREYARGIIKRAAYLCGGSEVDLTGIEPPYKSTWPNIPSQADIDAIAPDWSEETKNDVSWAHRHIRSSVMDDDFGRYVIGTNSGSTSFLSIRLDEPFWCSLDGQVAAAVARLSAEQAKAWHSFDEMRREIGRRDALASMNRDLAKIIAEMETMAGTSSPTRRSSPAKSAQADDLAAKQTRFLSLLDLAVASEFEDYISRLGDETKRKSKYDLRFDLKQVQRYVVARVFDLGWTSARFADFDEHAVDSSGRGAAKAERIGKKYQWIAYQEMFAFMADHFQYLDDSNREGPAGPFRGTWQDGVRDLDVSSTMTKRGTRRPNAGKAPPFWGGVGYTNWSLGTSGKNWAEDTSDLPPVERLIVVRDPDSATEWVNLAGHFKWEYRQADHTVSGDDGRRELWIACDAHLIRYDDLEAARSVATYAAARYHYHSPSGNYTVFMGELPWSDASAFFQQPYFGDSGWARLADGVSLQVAPTTLKYLRESGGFDCSVQDTFTQTLPHPALLQGLRATWSGISSTYVDDLNQVVAFDPTANEAGPSALLVRREALDKYLRENRLALLLVVRGEKRAAYGSPNYDVIGESEFSANFTYSDGVLIAALADRPPTKPVRPKRPKKAMSPIKVKVVRGD